MSENGVRKMSEKCRKMVQTLCQKDVRNMSENGVKVMSVGRQNDARKTTGGMLGIMLEMCQKMVSK